MLVVAAALGSLTVACGSPSSGASSTGAGTSPTGPPTTYGPISPPPAEVLDATVVFFDADGIDQQPGSPPPGVIVDATALDLFAQRYVDAEPALGSAARDALDEGKVLVGGTVSSGCFPAEGARLAFTAADVRLLPIGLPQEDPDVVCARAITSIALMAIDGAELPAGLPIRDTEADTADTDTDTDTDTDGDVTAWCTQFDVAITASAAFDQMDREDPGVDDALANLQTEMSTLSKLRTPSAIADDWEAVSGPPPTNETGAFDLGGALADAGDRIAVWALQECDLSSAARAALD